MELIFDMEGDGLYEQIHTIHCIVTKNIRNGSVLSWHEDPMLPREGTLDEGLAYMSKATRFAHLLRFLF